MLQLVVPFLLHCIGKVLFWKPLAMSCVVKNPSHPERETWTCGTMTSNVVLSLLVMRCWIIKAKFWSWSWGLQKRKVLKSHLCFQAYDKFQFTDYPEVKSDALIACHMKMLLKLIGCAVRVIAGVVSLMLGVPDSDELWWKHWTHIVEIAPVWILFAMLKLLFSKWKTCLRLTLMSQWFSQRLKCQFNIK